MATFQLKVKMMGRQGAKSLERGLFKSNIQNLGEGNFSQHNRQAKQASSPKN
jgi:hypothetical protein